MADPQNNDMYINKGESISFYTFLQMVRKENAAVKIQAAWRRHSTQQKFKLFKNKVNLKKLQV